MQTHLTAYLAEIDQRIMQMNPLADVIPQNIFNRTLRTSIQSVARSDLGYALTRPSLDALQNTLYGLVSNDFDSIYMTGVVFAGYGKKQLLPYTSHYVVDGRLDYIRPRARQSVFLRCWRRSIDDFNTNEDLPAIIIPYAQSDMFYLFMEGIMLKSLKYLQNTIRKTLSDKSDDLIAAYVPAVQQIVERNLQSQQNNAITAEIGRQFQEFRQVEYVNPILDVVQSLPKEEMSAMAEALVELTSLRRRVGSPLESVGGPTDVAFISKGDGFIWIKRKHYFNIDLNRDFMVRRRM